MEHDEQSEDLLFQKCLDLPPDAREEFVEQTCQDRPKLRDRLLRLLRSHENAPDFMESLPEEESASVAKRLYNIAPAEEHPGDLIGRYHLLELIGEGSWGSVWKAQQTKPIQRMVALKILKLGLDTKEFLARFEAERQALALMDHNHIARVLDAGSTDYGRPYMVMELVVGMPLLEYAEKRELDIHERVSLFAKICDAIHHAHQRKIIHRDLKPSNILITEQDGKPVPKIIDFGVAKTNQFRLTDKTLKTNINAFMGTPLYCSPEQLGLGGYSLDARSDIYSLGVVLYELLCGRTHYDQEAFADSSVERLKEHLQHTDPPRLSSRFRLLPTAQKQQIADARNTSIERVESSLKGELDWIVMKCLEKEPERRYASAQALADDLAAFLESRPVSAAAPSSAYRIRKYITRKRPAYAIWLEVALASVVLVALYLVFQLATRPHLNQTDRESANVTPVSLSRTSEKSIAILPFVNSSSREEDRFLADGIHLDLLTQISRINDIKTISPQSVAAYRDTTKGSKIIGDELGVTTLLTGEVEQIGEQIQVSVFLLEAETGVNLWTESYKQQLDSAADIFAIRNQIASAITDQLEAVLTPEELKHIERIPTQNLRAWEAYYKGREILATDLRSRMQEAGDYFQQAIDLDPDFAQAYTALAESLLRRTGISGDRLDPHVTSTEVVERAKVLVSKALELDEGLAEGHTLQGRFKRENEDYAGAEASFKRALEINPNYAQAWNDYAHLQKDKETMFAMVQKSIELDPSNAKFKSDLILQLCWVARFEEAIEVAEELIRTNPEYPRAYWLAAAVWMDAFGRYDKGVDLLRQGAAVDPRDVWVNNYLVMAYEFMGDPEEAARWQELKMNLRKDPPDLLQQLDLHRLRGEKEEALKVCREYLRQDGEAFRAWRYVLNADLRSGRYEEARARYEKITPYLFEEDPKIEIHGGRDFGTRYEQPRMAMQLAAVLFGTGEVEQATKLLERGWELFQQRSLMGSDGRFGYGIRDVVQHTLKGQKREALAAFREAVEAGYRDRWFLDCAELDPLREDPEFIALKKIITDELARQLERVREMDRHGGLPAFPELPDIATGKNEPVDSLATQTVFRYGVKEKSIAVLPFDNLSSNPEQAVLSAAIQEELIIKLSRMKELVIIGPASAALYRDANETLSQIGENLGANYLIQGSVQQVDDEVRVTVRLLKSQSGEVAWSQRYSRHIDHLFALSSDISKGIADEWTVVLSSDETEQVERPPTENQEAYQFYLLARQQRLGEKRLLLEKAVRLDPEFYEAWDELVSVLTYEYRWHTRGSDPELLAAAQEALTQIQRLEPESGRALSRMGYFTFLTKDDPKKALTYELKAMALGVGGSNVGLRYLQLGQLEEARFHTESAIRTDPLNRTLYDRLFKIYLNLGLWEKARQTVREMKLRIGEALSPYFDVNYYLSICDYLEHGDFDRYLSNMMPIMRSRDRPHARVWEALIMRDHTRAVEAIAEYSTMWFHLIGPPSPEYDQWLFIANEHLLSALNWFALGDIEKCRMEVGKGRTHIEATISKTVIEEPTGWSLLAIAHAFEGNRTAVEAILPRMRELTKTPHRQWRYQALCEMQVAIAYMILGDHDQALTILEAASQMDGPMFVSRELPAWFIFDQLKGNPRFEALLE